MAFHQNPVPLLVDVSRKREVVIVEEAQVQRQNRGGMIDRSLFDHNVARERVLRQIVLLREAFHLLFPLFFQRRAVPGLDIQLRSFRRHARGGQRHHNGDQDLADVFTLGHGEETALLRGL